MTTVDQPRVRDLTRSPRGFSLTVSTRPASELLMAMWALEDDDGDLETGDETFEEIRTRSTVDVEDALQRVSGGYGRIWSTLYGVMLEGPDSESVDGFIARLHSVEAIEFRKALILSMTMHSEVTDEQRDRAILGDAEALTIALACCGEVEAHAVALRRLLEQSNDQVKELFINAVTVFRDVVFSDYEESLTCSLSRDARAKAAMIATMTPEKALEKATGGITVDSRMGAESVLLVPSVLLRPWVVILEKDATRVFVYPVTEDNVNADPNSAPPWIVETYKALADERRLQVLRKLGQGPATFQEIVEHLAVAKSTAHHHLRVLRSSGLVRISLGAEKEYSLRRGLIAESARGLEEFIEGKE